MLRQEEFVQTVPHPLNQALQLTPLPIIDIRVEMVEVVQNDLHRPYRVDVALIHERNPHWRNAIESRETGEASADRRAGPHPAAIASPGTGAMRRRAPRHRNPDRQPAPRPVGSSALPAGRWHRARPARLGYFGLEGAGPQPFSGRRSPPVTHVRRLPLTGERGVHR